MKKLIIVILLAWVATAARAQQYFNKRYTLNSASTILTSVVGHHNAYYSTGICLDSSNHAQGFGYWGIKFSAFDSLGNIIRDTFYQKNGRNIYAWSNTLQKDNAGYFVLGVEAVDTGQWYLMLFRFDSMGNVLLEKEYQKPFCSGMNVNNDLWRLRDLKPDGNGNWLMLSSIACVTSKTNMDFLLTKLDSSFNVIWNKKYGHTIMSDIPSKILVEQDGYILAGGRQNTNVVSISFIYQAQLIKTDTAGNTQWTWLSPQSRLTNTIQDIIKTQDGGYVYCGQGDGVEDVAPSGTHSDILWNAWVEKLDVNRNSVWRKKIYNKYQFDTEFKTVMESADGRLLLFGNKYDADSIGANIWHGHKRGWFVTLASNGDSLQERIYSIINTCDDNHQIYDAKKITDGGYIMIGEATDDCHTFTPPKQQAWLLKVDSNGCMNPQCLFPTNIPNSPKADGIVKIYPNPVNDVLKVRCSQPIKGGEINLLDVMGRLVKTQSIKQGITEIIVKDLPAGVYVYRLYDKNGIVQQGKLLKQ